MATKPQLILVAGLPGTGKTTFAKVLSEKLDARHLNSDIVRSLVGKRGEYDPRSKRVVYNQLLLRTEESLLQGQNTVVDATFYKEDLRTPFIKLAERTGSVLKWIIIRANEETVKERLGQEREWSEADFEVYKTVKKAFEKFKGDPLELWSDSHTPDEMATLALTYIRK